MTYKIAIGYNNSAGFSTMSPQPKSEKMEYGRIRTNGEGLVIEDGYRSVEIKFGFLKKEQMDSLMTSFGLSETIHSCKITVSLPRNLDRDETNYNGIINAPTFTYDRGRYTEIVFKITRLSAI